MAVADGIGRFQQHKEQRQEQLFARVRRAGDPALPVANDLLGESELHRLLRPALLLIGKIRGESKMMLQQAILQLQTQEMNIATVKLPVEHPRAAVDQRLQVGVVIQRPRNAL